jgi:hypothetical protein
MIYLGLDPDLHNTGLAVVDEEGLVAHVEIIRTAKCFIGEEAVQKMIQELARRLPMLMGTLDIIPDPEYLSCTVEGQQIYLGTGAARPDSLLLLAQVAGAAAGILAPFCGHLTLPRPRKWKGSVPKPIHQARILGRMGWSYKKGQGYTIPTAPPAHLTKLKPEEWKHVVDAIGLAQWDRGDLRPEG